MILTFKNEDLSGPATLLLYTSDLGTLYLAGSTTSPKIEKMKDEMKRESEKIKKNIKEMDKRMKKEMKEAGMK